MASSINKVTILGNVGKDPEIRATQSGGKIANLTVATSESWKDKASGEKKERTEWHRVVIFNPHLVGVIETHVKKGTKLYLEGGLQTRKWTDQQGVDKYSTEIVLSQFGGVLVVLAGQSEASPSASPATQTRRSEPAGADRFDDDIPF